MSDTVAAGIADGWTAHFAKAWEPRIATLLGQIQEHARGLGSVGLVVIR